MKTYMKNTESRKTIVNRIGELTGEKLKYTMPGFTYKGQGFTVLKDGTMEADETADTGVIAALVEEGLIVPAGAEEPTGMTITLPLAGHTGGSLRNLVYMLYSKGTLISKATGGTFGCAEGLCDALKDDARALTTEKLIQAVADFESENGESLAGLSFGDGKVSFTGFPFTGDAEKALAFQQLACRMNKLAKEQKRVLARKADDSNERYIFRIWLLRLGMAGDEFKAARRILLSPLSGNAAFKDGAMEEKWKRRQAEKREALKAAQQTETEVAAE